MKSGLTRKLVTMILVVFLGLLSLNSVWSIRNQYQLILNNLYGKAHLIASQMAAAWQFMNVNQELINTTKDGNYEFKGLHCAIVGKSIGAIFSSRNETVRTHFTNLTTRNPSDRPDEFETKALRSFQSDPSRQEYYEVLKDENGEKVFRYLVRLTATESCLECHGEPKGSLDKTGYAKEGMKEGDLAGAISMNIAMSKDLEIYYRNVYRDMAFIGVFVLIAGLFVFIWMRKNVTKPLRVLGNGVWQMRAGNLSTEVDESGLREEFRELGHNFNQMTRELEKMYGSLEAQVAERTRELSELNEKLREDNELKSDFLSMMSHELKTPLTAILTFVTLLKRDSHDETERERMEEIEMNSRRLLVMINDILGMARIEAGNVQVLEEYTDVIDIMSQVKSVILPLAENKGVAFEMSAERGLPLVYVDADKLCHILENLCSNAVKFTGEGGRIRMIAEKSCRENYLQIKIQDNGIGIAPELLPRIFDKFVQADSSASRRYNGSGLGLALAREMAELLHGRIEVASEAGKGSEFTVILPVKWEGEEDEDTDRGR